MSSELTNSEFTNKAINPAPIILALESSTSACSVALMVSDTTYQAYEEGVNLHSTQMLKMVEQLLQEQTITLAQIDAVACGNGPGGFTGLRIGVGIAQGLAFSQGVPMVAVSSLDALAQAALNELDRNDDLTICAGLDARMSEFYWAEYTVKSSQLTLLGEYQICSPEEFTLQSGGLATKFIGNAWQEYAGRLNAAGHELVVEAASYALPQAKHIAELAKQQYLQGDVIAAQDLAPMYVRNDVAKKSTKNVLIK